MTYRSPYPELDAVVQELVGSLRHILRTDLVGVYLQGSFATGNFDEHSDCDFAVVVDDELSEAQVHELQTMHRRIFNLDTEWAKRLEGSYFPREILRDYTRSGSDLWYLDNGHDQLEKSNHCNKVVVRWILREKGVVLSGPEPSALIDPIPVKVLRRTILKSIIDSGREILANPEPYNNRFYQGFIVLQWSRKLHDLHTGTVGSKLSGAEWAKRHMDQSWSDLIDRAWDCRPNPSVSVRQPADNANFARTLQFVREVMQVASDFAAREGLFGESPD